MAFRMIAESGIRAAESAAGVDEPRSGAPKRQLVAAPPLAPALPPATPEGLPFLTVVAIAVLAGHDPPTGAPLFVRLGLLAPRLFGLCMNLGRKRTEPRPAALLAEAAARDRGLIASLADSTWGV